MLSLGRPDWKHTSLPSTTRFTRGAGRVWHKEEAESGPDLWHPPFCRFRCIVPRTYSAAVVTMSAAGKMPTLFPEFNRAGNTATYSATWHNLYLEVYSCEEHTYIGAITGTATLAMSHDTQPTYPRGTQCWENALLRAFSIDTGQRKNQHHHLGGNQSQAKLCSTRLYSFTRLRLRS